MKISWKIKPISTEIINFLACKTKQKFHMIKGIINAFEHMEFCLVINKTTGGNQAAIWLPPMFATMHVNFATILNTRYQVLAIHRKS